MYGQRSEIVVEYEIYSLHNYYKIENLVEKSQGFVKFLDRNQYSNVTISFLNDEKPKIKRILKVKLKKTYKIDQLENSQLSII